MWHPHRPLLVQALHWQQLLLPLQQQLLLVLGQNPGCSLLQLRLLLRPPPASAPVPAEPRPSADW
jgi:hypothetical protein